MKYLRLFILIVSMSLMGTAAILYKTVLEMSDFYYDIHGMEYMNGIYVLITIAAGLILIISLPPLWKQIKEDLQNFRDGV